MGKNDGDEGILLNGLSHCGLANVVLKWSCIIVMGFH